MLCYIFSCPPTFGIYELFHSVQKKKKIPPLCGEVYKIKLSTWKVLGFYVCKQ